MARRKRRTRGAGESGQAMVEFALMLPLFLLLLIGVIGFGKGLFYWLDLNKVANQSARWAVVNKYPGCSTNNPAVPCNPTLETYTQQALVGGEIRSGGTYSVRSGDQAQAVICYVDLNANGTPDQGDAVRVRITSRYSWMPILPLPKITLRGEATMRLEQKPTRFTPGKIPESPGCPQ